MDADKEAYVARVAPQIAARPATIARSDLRPTLRAAAMMDASRGMSPEDRVRIAEATFVTSTGVQTAADLAVPNGLVDFTSQFVDPEVYDTDADGVMDSHKRTVSRLVNEAIDIQTEKIDRAFDEVHDALHAIQSGR